MKYFYDIKYGKWVDSLGGYAAGPRFYAGSTPVLTIGMVTVTDMGTLSPVDLSGYASFRCAINAPGSGAVMARTLDPSIIKTSASLGELIIPVDTITQAFNAAVQCGHITACFELRAFDLQGNAVMVWQAPVTCLPAVDADGITLSPAPDTAPEFQYSLSGTSWHNTYETGDVYMRVRHGSSGSWSVSVPIPYGPQGEQGPAGPQGPSGASSWGDITGILSNQTDLQTALDAKVSDAFISGSTVSLKDQQGNVVIPKASDSSDGVLGRINEQNGLYQSGQWTVLSVPSTAQIDSRAAGKRAITPALLDYAVKAAMTDGAGTAWTDAERLAGTQRMRSTATLTGSTVTIASLLPNCDYVCSDPVEQLTITGSTASNIDTSITFTAGTSCSVSLPADMDDTNFTPPEANKRCYMGVVNGAAFSVIGGTATAGE